ANAMVATLPAPVAMERWMGSVVSRTAFLNPEMQTIGVGVDRTERGEWFCVIDATRGRGEPIVIYPTPRQPEVPISFAGGPDIPEPTAAAGFPISVSFPANKRVKAAQIELRDEQGKAVDGWVWTPDKPARSNPKVNALAIIPKGLLQSGTVYQ